MKRVLVVSGVFFVLMVSGVLPQAVGPTDIGHMGMRPGDSGLTPGSRNELLPPSAGLSDFYLTDNLTVPQGSTMKIVDENLMVESLNSSVVTINVSGQLDIVNSDVQMSGAPYSIARELNIAGRNGSTIFINGSRLNFAGSISLSGSSVSIRNSTLDSGGGLSADPSHDTLTMEGYNSSVSVYGSTIDGLYHQQGTMEYNDAKLYGTVPNFSQNNATIPMKTQWVHVESSLINRLLINVTYIGKTNETSNYISVEYGGSTIARLELPFNGTESTLEKDFAVNIPGIENSAAWMGNVSNLHLISFISASAPIAIKNITETMESNDTVALYGQGLYSYRFNDSCLLFLNSTIGLNLNASKLPSGILDPFHRFISLDNSTLLFGDSSLGEIGTYRSPFFSLEHSQVAFFRLVSPVFTSHGIAAQNIAYTIGPGQEESGNLSQSMMDQFAGEITNETATSMIVAGSTPVVYQYYTGINQWYYDNDFQVNASGSVSPFSISPFPALSRSTLIENATADVPYAILTGAGASIGENGTGTISLVYQGNLTQLQGASVWYSIAAGGKEILSHTSAIDKFPGAGAVDVPVSVDGGLPSGLYNLSIHMQSTWPVALANSGWINTTFTVVNSTVPPSYHAVNITETGLAHGAIWGVRFNGTSYFSSSSTLSLRILDNEYMQVLGPAGMAPSSSTLYLELNRTAYIVKFSPITYSVEFLDTGDAHGFTWNVLIGGENYSASGQSMNISLGARVYNYELLVPSGFTSTNTSGVLNLTDGPVTIHFKASQRTTLESVIVSWFSSPPVYLTVFMAVVAVISLLTWNASHSWYVCKNCGSTRKRKKDACPYCGE